MDNQVSVKRAKELGKSYSRAFCELRSCPQCGKQRWIERGRQITLCRSCARKANVIKPEEARNARELGRAGTGLFYARPCAVCGTIRWQRRSQKPTLCITCANRKSRKLQEGENSPTWKGGRLIYNGYVIVSIPKDSPYAPMAQKTKRGRLRIFEHRLVAAQKLGRLLEDWEVIHHINGIRDDNRPENIDVLPNHTVHLGYTKIQEQLDTLTETVQSLKVLVKMLLWYQLQYGNTELNPLNGSESKWRSAETKDEDSLPINPRSALHPNKDEDIVHTY